MSDVLVIVVVMVVASVVVVNVIVIVFAGFVNVATVVVNRIVIFRTINLSFRVSKCNVDVNIVNIHSEDVVNTPENYNFKIDVVGNNPTDK